VVLVEEFTGIDCVNCPAGSEKLEVLSRQNPGKIIIVGIHARFFAREHDGFDLRCTDGESLETYFGPVSGYPASSINHKVFEGESDVVADLSLTNTYDAATRMVSIRVDMTPSIFFVDAIDENLDML